MGLFANLWHGLLTSGLPLLSPADNPRVYPFALGAITLTIVLTIVRLIQTRHASTLLGAVFGLAVIELAWLGFSTPVDQLFGFAPSTATTIAAEAIHGLLALMPLVLVAIWLLQLSLSPTGLWSAALQLATCALAIAGIETQPWPADLVVVLEVLLSFTFFAVVGLALLKVTRDNILPWLRAFYFGLWSAALLLILFAHPVQSPLVALCTLFLAIIWLDGLAGNSPRRFLITVPLVLMVGTLGAANVFAPLLRATGLTFSVWVEATSAGAVFLLIAPLIDWTQGAITANIAAETERVSREKQAVDALESQLSGPLHQLSSWLSGTKLPSMDQLIQMRAQARADEQRLLRLTRLAERLNRELDTIAAVLFFALLVAYYLLIHFAATLPDPVPVLRPIVGATLITAVGVVLNQAIMRSVASARKLSAEARGNDAFRHAAFDPVRRVVAVFLSLILGIYGIGGNLGIVVAQGNCSDPGNTSCVLVSLLNDAPHMAGIAPLALLGSGDFWIAVGRVVAGVALVLLALGQWRFVSVVDKARKATQAATDKGSEGASGSGSESGASVRTPEQSPERIPAAATASATHGR